MCLVYKLIRRVKVFIIRATVDEKLSFCCSTLCNLAMTYCYRKLLNAHFSDFIYSHDNAICNITFILEIENILPVQHQNLIDCLS